MSTPVTDERIEGSPMKAGASPTGFPARSARRPSHP